jgi:hypothetical protein
MRELRLSFVFEASRVIQGLEEPVDESLSLRVVPPDLRDQWMNIRRKALSQKTKHWLPNSTAGIDRVGKLLDDPDAKLGDFYRLIAEAFRRIEDEMSNLTYVELDARLAHYFHKPSADWHRVISTFPQLRNEIRQASRCLAFERNTACVFHLMRVMEVGLEALRRRAKVRRRRATWDAIIMDIDKKLNPKPGTKKPPRLRRHMRVMADAVMRLRAVKDAWRNPTMHEIQHVYDSHQAEQVYISVRSFMRKMAEIHEVKPKK